MDSKKLISTAIAGVVAIGLAGAHTTANAAKPGYEKCYGVAAANKNDCGSATHACAGQAKKAKDGQEWIYLPSGTCEKISGGSTTPKKDDNGTKS